VVVSRRDSWFDQEEDDSDTGSSSSSGDVVTRQIAMPSSLALDNHIYTGMDTGANELPISPSTKRRKVGGEVPQVLSDSDGLEKEAAVAPTQPANWIHMRKNQMASHNAPTSNNSLNTARQQQQQQQRHQQQQQHMQLKPQYPHAANLGGVNLPMRSLSRVALLDNDGGLQASLCHPGNVGNAQQTATKVAHGSAVSDATKTPTLSADAGGQQTRPNGTSQSGTSQLDASARLAAIKARMAERKRLQDQRAADTAGLAPVAKPVSMGHPMDMVEPPPKYRNEVWFRPP